MILRGSNVVHFGLPAGDGYLDPLCGRGLFSPMSQDRGRTTCKACLRRLAVCDRAGQPPTQAPYKPRKAG